MSEKKVTKESIAKALSVFAALSEDKVQKGHSSRGTVATAVETPAAVAGDSHVLPGSPKTPPGWAGTSVDRVSEDDGIAENGTDYVGGGMAKSILELFKAGKISEQEAADLFAKGGFGKDKGKDKPSDDEDDDDKVDDKGDDKGYEFGKSKGKGAVKKSFKEELPAEVQDMLEVSDVLAAFADTVQKSMASLEERVLAAVTAGAQHAVKEQGRFNKSLASAIGTLGEAFVAQASRVEELESSPARGPKSTQITKSIASGELSRPEVLDTLVELVVKGLASDDEVISFESSGRISDETLARVKHYRAQK